LGNVLNNVDLNRIGADLTALELDGGTVKVSVGSIIESQGSLYKVDTAAVTPTGTATAGAYLFFDDSVPGFVWSATAGTYDPARGGIYDASDRRQCRFYLTSSTTFRQNEPGNDNLQIYRYSYTSGIISTTEAVKVAGVDSAYGGTVPRDVVISCIAFVQSTLGSGDRDYYNAFKITAADEFFVYGRINDNTPGGGATLVDDAVVNGDRLFSSNLTLSIRF
jgi:hypothetical protein